MEIALEESFDAIILVYLDLGTFSPTDLERVSTRVRRWLAPGGIFVFDVMTPRARAGGEKRRDWGVAERGFWADEPHAWLTRTLRYEPGPTYLDEHTVITSDGIRRYRVWERCFTPETISDELAAAGLTVRSVYGDLTGTPYVPQTSTALGIVAGPA